MSGWCARFQLLLHLGDCFGVCTGLCNIRTGFCDKRFFSEDPLQGAPYFMAVELNFRVGSQVNGLTCK